MFSAPGMVAPGMKAPGMVVPGMKMSTNKTGSFHPCDLPPIYAGESLGGRILVKIVLLGEVLFWLGLMVRMIYILVNLS